ncbi:MAG TPA: hypothetical protein VFV58_36765, partial [Blastocatellia bacterium]|nr:hypothetical protein [Blastocatellia bacterium]
MKSCARIGIVSVKVWLLGRWRLAQGFFDAMTVEGETMNIFACATLQDLLIPLGFALGLGVVIALVIIG